MEEILLFFALKYQGDFQSILKALQAKEKVSQEERSAVFSARRVPRSVLDGKRISEDSTGSIYCCWIRSSDVPDRKRGWNTTARNVNSCPSIPSTSCRRFALTKAVSPSRRRKVSVSI